MAMYHARLSKRRGLLDIPNHPIAVDYNQALAAFAKSLALIFWLSDLSCPHAAMISRPRGVRTGEA
jgi:hypothetical protein